MKSFIISLLLGPVVATNGATLRRLQFPGGNGGGGFMNGIISDIVSGESGAAPAVAEGTHFAEAMKAPVNGEGSEGAMPALFGGAATPPAGPFAAASPPWAAASEEGEESKLTVRQKFQLQFGMEVTPDPYGIPAPETPALPFGEAPESPFVGAAVASPFAEADASAESPFGGIAASLGGGAGVGSRLRGGITAQAAAPGSQTQQTGNMTPEQQRAAAITAAAAASASVSSTPNTQLSSSVRLPILPSASRY